eukprot:765826-Hanusia_phi.AAC.4
MTKSTRGSTKVVGCGHETRTQAKLLLTANRNDPLFSADPNLGFIITVSAFKLMQSMSDPQLRRSEKELDNRAYNSWDDNQRHRSFLANQVRGFIIKSSTTSRDFVISIDPNHSKKAIRARAPVSTNVTQDRVHAAQQKEFTNERIPAKKQDQSTNTGHNIGVASNLQVNPHLQQAQSITQDARVQQTTDAMRSVSNVPHVIPTFAHTTSNKPAEQSQQAEKWSNQQVLLWLHSTLSKVGVQEKAIELYSKKFQIHGLPSSLSAGQKSSYYTDLAFRNVMNM